MNEHDQQTLGAALGRAIDAQTVRETRFADSHLAAELARGGGSGFPLFRYAAAAAVVVLVLGVAYVAAVRPQLGPAATPTPSESAPVVVPSPTPTARPTGTPLPGQLNHSIIYCGRAGAPPFAIAVPGIDGATPEDRIRQRLEALEKLRPLGPTEDGPCRSGFPSTARIATVTLSGDTATLEYTLDRNGEWGHVAKSIDDPVIQEIVYTASEEPRIRRIELPQIGGLYPIKISCQRHTDGCDTFTRESVLGYAVKADTSFSIDGEASGTATTRWSVDAVAPGLVRFVIEVQGSAEPKATVRAQQNDETANPDLGKWSLYIEVPGATHTPGSQVIDNKTPLRSVQTVTTAGTAARYVLGLDDLRPWRVALIPGSPTRIVVDIGGPTANVADNLAVYAAEVTGRQIHLTGAARAFEAHVSWRMKDASGREIASGGTQASIGTSQLWGVFDTNISAPQSYSGSATLEVFLASARDGSPTNLVAIPIRVG